ncbi:MAG: aminoacyl-tRNA hydrolase [Patescibacteria group bacterium]|jgi:PTH1 family peptidyl-tRNA hydrolase
MKIIVGLGNPGKQYEGTRHNAGFVFVDALSKSDEITAIGETLNFKAVAKFEAEIAETQLNGEKLIVIKPQTYMNLSGNSVAMVMQYYKAEIADLVVVSDDIDLPVGTARIRHEGSSGGQKGLQNIIDILRSDSFSRLRIGVKSELSGETDNPTFDAANFVLSKFSKQEKEQINQIIAESIKYLLLHLGQKQEIPAHTIEI